jgi:superfamily II DNA or RNA helicase
MIEETKAWHPNVAGQAVRLKANPGQQGITTGKTRQAGSRLLVQVQFGPNEKSYKPYHLLECCREPEGILDLLGQGRFGNPDDLRRILTLEKLKGHLTNIFYSMESSNTDFYPHQFKPILKFIESPIGRLLIADEVGLGKTIEAMYAWKELQARVDARRLLIICPAILREKWRSDLKNHFNILADITNAQELLEKVRAFLETPSQHSFACIASLESLRPSANWADETVKGKNAKAELARLLDKNTATDEWGIFDLVVIDEAHYLRNPTTANNRIGRLVRDASRYLLLLTATPVQIDNSNLYQLLKLISPDDFFNESIFKEMLDANAPVVKALRLTWRNPPDLVGAKRELNKALKSSYFDSNSVLKQIHQELLKPETIDTQARVRLGYKLENSSLIGQYISRSRKRDVLPERVERASQTLVVSFSLLEKKIYDYVTHQIRQQTKGRQGIPLFKIITRQRQMASCMVAALQAWSKQGILNEMIQEDELLWEDFGVSPQLSEDTEEDANLDIHDWPFLPGKIDYTQLEKQDTKYKKLIDFISQELKNNPNEKFVLFAYFRGTLQYLQQRLKADNIRTCLIVGNMDDKQAVLEKFETGDASVLLSSEVGSEGIDLQFCRFLINYDLPWNPMRVEQRIGRLDRLGQKAERISIINFSLVDTVEERILERLYERINIFKESIGDLENILGDMTEKLLIELFEPNLSDAERSRRAEEKAMAIIKQRLEQERLENEAINMFAFSDYLIDVVTKSREQGRWLHPEELHSFVEDFFARYYPGTTIEPVKDKNYVFNITLSEDAKIDLQQFLKKQRCATSTRLTSLPVTCFFDPKVAGTIGKDKGKLNELLDPTHPLIQWIRERYEAVAPKFHAVCAAHLEKNELNLVPGLYIYVAHRWSFTGLRTENQIAYKVARCADGQLLSDELSEALVAKIALQGQPKPNAINLLGDMDEILAVYSDCDDYLEEAFNRAAEDFGLENMNRCDVQQRSAEDYANRRRQELKERIERFRTEGKLQMIPATEGLLNKVNRELELKLRAIAQRRNISLDQVQLAAGVIFVE